MTTERTRTFTWDDPTIGATAARHLSGLDYLRGMARGDYPPPPIARALDFSLLTEDDIQDGRVTFRMTPQEYHYNPIGSVHGGVYATLLDSALGCAIHTKLHAGVGYTTVDLAVKYLRPLLVGTPQVMAVAEVISVSRQVATAEARLVDERGKLYAHATTTCLILRPDRA
ncbi:PaaI family thioesterase [Deinococcus maricopensis]|uniref:Phenylacetic acid degradation-related protein n=1 Tax=Deinococcus maricopensis (strain DSM 21211 / LMG 22137 / NRRL B-23946 / LB-34) TaxID=709986 RepID=E8U7N2_DEIML|nr:PaaI family thioesterase [Deinococcus maricopensis]ADV67071.1 phenylacetic acid degradation-related protein [Deinococcus maricopensis DSM 21211]